MSVRDTATGGETLEALERRGDEREAFADCLRQANAWMTANGTQSLVDDLRQARADHRRIRLATINALVLLAHIDRLEAALAKPPLVLP